jgi:DNA-binding LytR/AlgR family response regulator
MLDFIWKKENIEEKLNNSIKVAYDVINSQNSYTFQYDGEMYHISFNDIYYFEKDLNDNYTFLYTENFVYKIKESIAHIEKKLDYNPMFLKIHRSCIVNIEHIDNLDLRKNIINIGKYSTNLISKESINLLKKKLNEDQIIK